MILVSFFVVVGGVLWLQAWRRENYPYGASHSCSKGLGLDLELFADANEGWFPHGMPTPEASLSLLCTNTEGTWWILRGKHVSQKTVDEALARDSLLGPDSCGWHYVEGLRTNDEPQIAVAWDKARGLNHGGRRMRGLEHEVILVDGSVLLISQEKWPAFVEEQKRLLAETASKRSKDSPSIRWSDENTLGPNKSNPKQGFCAARHVQASCRLRLEVFLASVPSSSWQRYSVSAT